jgi:hypothetical protein
MIIVPLDSAFGRRPNSSQRESIGQIQSRANSAGLRGTVVPVWDNGGRMQFIAPSPWHPFFKSLNLGWVLSQVNRELSW